jgi:UPF0042 nucleotide-binding protein
MSDSTTENQLMPETPARANNGGINNTGRLVIVIGQSGSGHSTALDCLEDAGFSAIDNLPLALIDQLVALSVETEKQHIAVCADLRTSGFDAKAIERLVENLRSRLADQCQLVLITAQPQEILRRYQATRRRHPLQKSASSLEAAIETDQISVDALRHLADLHIDSTDTTPTEFRSALLGRLGLAQESQAQLKILSFSYRRGLPSAADFIFDMRFLANPHWQKELRAQTGQDSAVKDFVHADEAFQPFMDGVIALVLASLPRLRSDGRGQITLAFGCTGGRHRSVASANWFANWAATQKMAAQLYHRDL